MKKVTLSYLIKVSAGIAIVPKVPDVPQSMLPGVLLQVHLLERDLSRVFYHSATN